MKADSNRLRTGRDQFGVAILLAFGCWIADCLLQASLYLRPAPHGGPFLLEWNRYFWLALYYGLLGTWLLAMPFLLFWLAMFRRAVRPGLARALHFILLGLLSLGLMLAAIDHEILRFLGLRLNLSFVLAYAQPEMLGDQLFVDLLAFDRGGPFLAVLLPLLLPGAFFWWGWRRLRRPPPLRAPPLWLALVLALLLPAAPANGWLKAGGYFRLRKIEPVPIALAVDLRSGFADLSAPADLATLAAEHQHAWLARSTDPGWRFVDPSHPYLRAPSDPSLPAPPHWNIIYLQLETFRGVDMGFLRPGRRSVTPRLDRFAARPDAATWSRVSSFGMPSINGLFATHCSIAPPSRRYITTYTHASLHCLPGRLRGLGYRTEMFNGGDTDWDNSSPWLRAWYDRLWRFPEAQQRDRDIFRAAARRIRMLGRSGRPFLASVVSVTNHIPFRSRDPAFDIGGRSSVADAILNTTHYTDDVVGEFLETLEGEPWFARTIVVIVGDHGLNLGEHGRPPGQHDLYRESVWVPLIIAGPHPRLAGGTHSVPASLLDVAPTLADLLGLREANPWQGHSLLGVNEAGATAFAFRGWELAENAAWSAVRDPDDGQVRLFARTDWLQQRDLAPRFPDLARLLAGRARRAARLNDFLLRRDRIVPHAAPQPRPATRS